MATETLSKQQQVGPETENGDGSDSLLKKKSCIFYKLIVDSMLQVKKLRIPEKFVRKYGNELSSIATLIASDGRSWLVVLKRIDLKLWFQDGWHEFVEYYSIHDGYFLVFTYEGNSTFIVRMYDLTASEIKYPLNSPPCNLQEPGRDKQGSHCHEKELGDNVTVKIVGCSTPLFSRGKAFDECEYPKRINFTNPAFAASAENLHLRKDVNDSQVLIQSTQGIDIQFNERELADETEQRIRKRKQTIKPNRNVLLKNHEDFAANNNFSRTFTRRWRAVTNEEKLRANHTASTFKSANPFCQVVLRPSYVFKGMLLHMPNNFARTYLNVTQDITLQLSDGKKWRVRCVWNDREAKLSKGWSVFVLENNLDDGDVCIFELIKTNDIVLKVAIFRVLEEQQLANQP